MITVTSVKFPLKHICRFRNIAVQTGNNKPTSCLMMTLKTLVFTFVIKLIKR